MVVSVWLSVRLREVRTRGRFKRDPRTSRQVMSDALATSPLHTIHHHSSSTAEGKVL